MKFNFENKTTPVSGTGSGLTTTRAFADTGASVALADIDEKALQSKRTSKPMLIFTRTLWT